VEGAAVIRAKPIEVGQRLPLGVGAGSAAILSTCADDEVQEILEEQDANFDLFPGGREEIPHILERVKFARKHGYAMSAGTVAKGVSGVGVPVLPRQGLMQLAVSISAVTESMDFAEAKRFADIIKTTLKYVDTRHRR
jgi:DNA-binding IclR family transcriptional regulator